MEASGQDRQTDEPKESLHQAVLIFIRPSLASAIFTALSSIMNAKVVAMIYI